MSKLVFIFQMVFQAIKKMIKAAVLSAALGLGGLILMVSVYLIAGIMMALITGSFAFPAVTITAEQIGVAWFIVWLGSLLIVE